MLAACVLSFGCSMIQPSPEGPLPPILKNDEVIRSHEALGRIQVVRETYGSDYILTPDVYEWGFKALRREAAKMGGDAVIDAEITARTMTFGLFPTSEYRATGMAIKFK